MYATSVYTVHSACILNSLNVNRDKTEKLMETKTHFSGHAMPLMFKNIGARFWSLLWLRLKGRLTSKIINFYLLKVLLHLHFEESLLANSFRLAAKFVVRWDVKV